jgi:hypothetical protein
MTERIPPPFGASRTVRSMRRRHDLVLRLHDALRGDGTSAPRKSSPQGRGAEHRTDGRPLARPPHGPISTRRRPCI